MSSSHQIDLARAALRARGSSRLVAGLLPAWERAFGMRPTDFLSTDDAGIAALALCTRPAPDRWEADVAAVASACNLDQAVLANFLRQALSVERLASAPPVADVVDGRLLAARDREEEE